MLNSAFTSEATATPAQLSAPVLTAVKLGRAHAPALAKLIAATREALPEEKRHHLKPKTVAQINAHFAAFNPAFGLLNKKGQLIACAMLCPLDPQDEHAVQNYPAEHLMPGNWSLQSVAKHPDYKGHDIMPVLINHTKVYAKTNPQIDFVVAKVNSQNNPGKQILLKSGFAHATVGHDVASGDPVVYLGLYTGSGLARDAQTTLQSGYDEPTTPQRR